MQGFQSQNETKKSKRQLHVGTTKTSHIYSCIDFFQKVLHHFEVKNSVSSKERKELSKIQVVSIVS